MNYNAKFWISLAVFQVAFGYAVFAVTREYYLPEPGVTGGPPATTAHPAPEWAGGITASDVERLTSPLFSEPDIKDPAEMSRRADEFFAQSQYGQAARLYERLLAFRPNNAEVYNNLGLTLHYIGRSAEALRRLNEGVAVDPGHQRIWLTLGFVNSRLGNTEEARRALNHAIQVGDDETIRQSARKMLEELP